MNTVKQLLKHKNFMFKLGLAHLHRLDFDCHFGSAAGTYHPITHQNMAGRFQPPSAQHWFGTDSLAGCV
jgi:ABC-type dipeptide/oligopeptide/nickel transport system permease subunit